MINATKHISTLTSGTVTVPNLQQDCIVFHNAASLALTLTVTLPANPTDGQSVTIVSTLGVTGLTVSSSLPIIGTLTGLAAAGFITFIYEASINKWFRIG